MRCARKRVLRLTTTVTKMSSSDLRSIVLDGYEHRSLRQFRQLGIYNEVLTDKTNSFVNPGKNRGSHRI